MFRGRLIAWLVVISAAQLLGLALTLKAKSLARSPAQDQAEDGSTQARIKFTATPYLNPESVAMVPPRYPPIAKAFRIQGQVVLEVTVDQDGRLSDVRPQSGSPLLLEAAEKAVRQWRYEPSLRLPAGLTVAFEYQLAEEDKEQARLERSDAGHSPDLMIGFTKYSPEYPKEAQREGIEGQVALEVIADAQNGVVGVRVLKSDNALLAEAALEVARQPFPVGDRSSFDWKPGRNTMVINFRLDEPRRLTADSPVPAVGYLTSAPPGLLVLHHEFADYPGDAKNNHVQGRVEVELTLDANGDVAKAEVLRGSEPLRDAALEAAQHWRFSPPPEARGTVIVTYDFQIIN
jgi:TonB family protein